MSNQFKTVIPQSSVLLKLPLVLIIISFLCVASLSTLTESAHAEWTSQGEVTIESRIFTPDNDARTKDQGFGLFSRISAAGKSGVWEASFGGMGRVDGIDRDRDVVQFEDTWVGARNDNWTLRGGFQILNWGVHEIFKPSDFINSRNYDSDVERPEKKGELMVSIARRVYKGQLTAFWMPRYEPPHLPGSSSRLNFAPPGTAIGNPVWVERNGTISTNNYGLAQGGARLTQHLLGADFSLYSVYHMDRWQPAIATNNTTFAFHPLYFKVLQSGATYTQVFGSWIVKWDMAYRKFDAPSTVPGFSSATRKDHFITAAGVEYNWAHSNGSDSTFYLEAQNIWGTTQAERQALHLFQRDLFAGYRYAFNDADGKDITAVCIFDAEFQTTHQIFFNLSYGQRLTDTWKIRGGFRLVDAPQKHTVPIGLESLDRSHLAFINLTRSF